MTYQRSLSLITILVVENSEQDRATYSRYLQSDIDTTYRLIEAETLEDGLSLWRSQSPDIVLIDLNLPDGSGLDLLEAINVDRAGERIPAIMLTEHGSEKIAVRAMKLGASDYLLKREITPMVLTKAVKQVLRETILSQQLLRSQQLHQVISEMSSRIHKHCNLEDVLNITAQELREFIKADRVAVYQFNPDMSGSIVSENVGASWKPTLNVLFEDTCFRENLREDYCNGKIFVANDIYSANLQDCHIQLLESFQVRANLVLPIRLFKDNKQFLWGLLIIHQCSDLRVWTELEIQLVQRISVQLELAIQQMISHQNLERELKNRQIAEQALQESEQMNRAIVETIPDLLIQMDRNGTYRYKSECAGNVRVILPDPSVSELRIDNILPKHLAQSQVYHANLALDSGEVQIFEQIVDFDDERRYEEVRVAPIDDREVLMIIRDITDRKRTEIILKKLLEGTAPFAGEDFFSALVVHITEAWEVAYAFITELVDDKLHCLAFCANGELQPNFSYQPPSTPCEYVLNNDEYYCERDLQKVFPQDLDLVSLKAESYLGIVLKDHRGNAIGHLCILDVKPLPSNKITETISILKIFASRAAVELQRKRTNDEILKVTKLKDDFLANMSHEIRTPLNSILGLSEALQDQIFGVMNEAQLKAISTVSFSAQHLLSLINDILDLSKISSGMMELEIESASVRFLCDSSLVSIKQKAYKKNLQVINNIPMVINDINIDIRLTKQVLINLLSNAVKFTPEGGKVSLLVTYGSGDKWHGEATVPQQLRIQNSPMILFQVVDTGIGIASKDLQRIFQPFVQVSSSFNRQHEGTGLGLALVKKITEIHGGQVIAESELGKGSCFTIALPYDTSSSNASVSTSTKVSTTLLPQSINLEKTSTPLILLAEDNEANIQNFTAYLSAINYRIVVARNGKEAIAQAKATCPDIIIMNSQMPDMDGLEVVRLIRADAQLATIPIIALTALAIEGDCERYLEIGANKYLSQPVKLRLLASAVQQLCYKSTNVG